MTKVRINLFISFMFIIFALIFTQVEAQEKSLRVNIFTRNNGVGLERDAKIMKAAMIALGVDARIYKIDKVDRTVNPANINIFFENPGRKIISKANRNWFVPNPEWFGYPLEHLKKFDLILCRTREVERIFTELNLPTYYLGFTSLDRYDPLIQKNPRQLLHLAGRSVQKGTSTILLLWNRRADLPILRMVKLIGNVPDFHHLISFKQYLPENDLIELQNQSGIHLCPSETEGFGHYLMEAMSAKAVVLTTNAPPMNEFIVDPRCLVEYSRTAPKWLATNYYVDIDDLEAVIRSTLELSDEELQEIGERNRKEYLERTEEFKRNLKRLVEF